MLRSSVEICFCFAFVDHEIVFYNCFVKWKLVLQLNIRNKIKPNSTNLFLLTCFLSRTSVTSEGVMGHVNVNDNLYYVHIWGQQEKTKFCFCWLVFCREQVSTGIGSWVMSMSMSTCIMFIYEVNRKNKFLFLLTCFLLTNKKEQVWPLIGSWHVSMSMLTYISFIYEVSRKNKFLFFVDLFFVENKCQLGLGHGSCQCQCQLIIRSYMRSTKKSFFVDLFLSFVENKWVTGSGHDMCQC